MAKIKATPPTDEQLASVGPIEGKAPDQAAAHRMIVLRNSWRRLDTSWDDWQDQLGKVREARLWEFYPTEHPYGSLPELLKANGIEPDYATRKEAFENRAAQCAMQPEGLHTIGTNQYGCDNYNSQVEERGTSATYYTARIARDHPAILERMKRGEFRSVRAAAIEASIIDPDQTKRYSLPPDPEAAGRYLAQRVDREWMAECYRAYMAAEEK